MKYLQDYMNKKQTKLFEETGTFFAFGNKQYKERAKKGVKYVNMGNGMITEKPNVEKLINGLDLIYKEAIQEDIKENGKEAIILRELENHECFYVGNIEDAVRKLEDYPFTEDDIAHIYKKNYSRITKRYY
jgi:hypothetical protein